MSALASLKILVCFAVKEEASPFLQARHKNALLAACDVEVLITGMGRANSERTFMEALKRRKPDLVITCGFAGGLSQSLETGDLVFATPAPPALEPALQNTGARPATFHCAERVAVTAAEKEQLRRETGADVVEMESGVIAGLCSAGKIPCLTFRVILDTAGEDLPLDFNAVLDHNQQLQPVKVALHLAKSPARIPGLLRLRAQTLKAAQQLGQGLTKLLTSP